MIKEIKDLMEKHFLSEKHFGYGTYVGQSRQAREFAVKRFGIEKTALMSDADIELEFKKRRLDTYANSL